MQIVARRSSLALLAAVAAALAALTAPAAATAAEGQIIVRYDRGADARDRSQARRAADVVRDEALGLPRAELVTPKASTSVAEAVADLERDPDVAYAEPDRSRRAFDLWPDEAKSTNNVSFGYLWAFHNPLVSAASTDPVEETPTEPAPAPQPADIGAPAAWDITTGSENVKVAVVDSGVDQTHPDLFANLVPGTDFAYDDTSPDDYAGHGTHVAGIIAARGNNGHGVTGVAWQTALMPVQVLDKYGDGSLSDVVAGYTYAAEHGADIVNASLGGTGFSKTEYDAIKAAPDVLFVVAAGNDGADGPDVEYPCAYDLPNIVCVAATDDHDRMADFSNYGASSVDIAAPGVGILSTYRCGGYGWMDGTSMAAPEVSGAAALLLARHPNLTPAEVRALLMQTGDPLSAGDAARIGGGHGTRLDVGQALAELETPQTPTDGTTIVDSGTSPATAERRFAPARVGEPAAPASLCPSAPAKVPTSTGGSTSTPVTPAPAPVVTATPRPASTPAPATPAPPTTARPADRTAPTVAFALPRRLVLRTVLSRGLRLPATSSERSTVRVTITVDGRTAKHAGLSKRASRKVTVATGRATLSSGSKRSVRVRFTAKARRALRRLRSVRTAVRVTATDAAGNRRTRARSLTLAR